MDQNDQNENPQQPDEQSSEPTTQEQEYQGRFAEDEPESLALDTEPEDKAPADDQSDASEQSDDEPVFTPDQPKVNFDEQLPTTGDLKNVPALEDMLTVFREAYSNVSQVLDRSTALLESINAREEELTTKARKQNRELEDHEGNPWFRTVMNALTYAQINEFGENSLAREDAQWNQILDYEGQSLRPGQPKQKLGGAHHSKEETTTYLARRAGVSTVFDVPLYHSGVWLRMKTPPLSAITGLQYEMQQIKVTLGSDSKGMAFSNTSQVLTSVAVDFALQYVIDSNVHYTTPSDLKEKIQLLDVPMLLWGLAVTLYPKGFPYAHPCVADVEKCQHVTKETLNLNRLFWTDSTSLTQNQKKLMARKFIKLTEDEHRLYLTEHTRGTQRLVWFDELGLTLKVPTLQEYEDAGQAWINGIVEMTQGAFNEPPHGSNRDQYITRLGMATTARQYSHWITSVHEKDDEGNEEMVSDDSDVINETLNHIFSTDEFVDTFFGEVTRFMDDSLISMIAIPSFNCPKCNTPAAESFKERFEHLVPIDVLTTFFTLVSLKHS
jgi:hypothetical protein